MTSRGNPPTSRSPGRTCGKPLTRPADPQDGNTTKGPGRNSRERLTDEQRDELRRWNLQNRWSPNQLRHTAATQVRKLAGLETARAVLGHSTSAVTEQYDAEVDLEKAASVIQRIG